MVNRVGREDGGIGVGNNLEVWGLLWRELLALVGETIQGDVLVGGEVLGHVGGKLLA